MTATLILGAAVRADGPSPTLLRRTRHAAALYRAGVATHLVPCGGLGAHPPAEAVAMRTILLAEGVPDAAITIEDRSTSTAENIRLALPILAALGATEALIVTDAVHAPRARLAARRMGLTARTSSPPLRGSHRGQLLRSAARECAAYLVYAIRLRR